MAEIKSKLKKRGLVNAGAEYGVPNGTLTDMDMAARIKKMQQICKKVGASRKAARQFLLATGFYTPKGQLKHRFR